MEEIIKFTPDAVGPRLLLEQNGQSNGQTAIEKFFHLEPGFEERLERATKKAKEILDECPNSVIDAEMERRKE